MAKLLYSPDLVISLETEHSSAQAELQDLMLQAVQVGQSLSDVRAKEFMLHGAARRLKLLSRCLSSVFQTFPPSSINPLQSEDLDQVQISLQAFVMNLYGLFENLAWTFVLRHGLESEVGGRKKIGMFLESTQRFLPDELSSYLTSPTMTTWHTQYLKSYRDALAHRIPLYIPPATFTPEESDQHALLWEEEQRCVLSQQWDRLEKVRAERGALGKACPVFLHSFSEDAQLKPVYLHPQMLCDIKTVLEFGPLYFAHWDKRKI